MLPLTVKKWRNVFILGIIFFGIIFFSEVLPMVNTSVEQMWSYVSTLNSDIDINELKREMNFNINKKKHLTSIRKGLFMASPKTTSNAALIMSIDSIGTKHGCRLISVQPMEGKENSKSISLRFQFKTNYASLYNMLHDLRTLPVLFTIKELVCDADDEQPRMITVSFLIALVGDKEEDL